MAPLKNPSTPYWKERELNHIEKGLKDDRKIAKELNRLQKEAMKDIEKEVDSLIGKYAKEENLTIDEARKKITKTEVNDYKRKAKKYTENQIKTEIANEQMRIYNVTMKTNRLELLKANINLEIAKSMGEEQLFLETEFSRIAREEYLRQAGILGETIAHNEKNIKLIVGASFHSAKWDRRIWTKQEALRLEIEKLLNRGIVQGLGSKKMARELRKKFNVSIAESERLMRTERARIEQDVFREAGNKMDFEGYIFIAEKTACKYCKPLDDKFFTFEESVIGENAFPMHPNCRCSQAMAFDREGWEQSMRLRGLYSDYELGKNPNMKKDVDKIHQRAMNGEYGAWKGDLDVDLDRMKRY